MPEDNWPDPERPGIPMFPEQDGLHVIRVSAANFIVRHWSSKYRHYFLCPTEESGACLALFYAAQAPSGTPFLQ